MAYVEKKGLFFTSNVVHSNECCNTFLQFVYFKKCLHTLTSSCIQDLYMVKIAAAVGGPIYCLMSALSTNARSMAPVTLDVVSIKTFGYLKFELNTVELI